MKLYCKDNPYLAKVKERYQISHERSTKKTHHVVIDIEGSGLSYSVGDVIGIYPTHEKNLVQLTLDRLGATGQEEIVDKRTQKKYLLKKYLTSRANITEGSRKLLSIIKERQTDASKKAELEKLFENRERLKHYLKHSDLWHILEEHSEVSFSPQEFCDLLMPLLPRFYSIASSPRLFPNEIHLTVAVVNYETKTGIRPGVCSSYITEINSHPVPIYLQPHKGFTLPKDSKAPIIMVGPGTGVAPFRAFIQERLHSDAFGEMWLFFGERNRELDFLYEKEWIDYVNRGALRLETAFSRDQKEKVYVQHKLLEHASKIFSLLEQGAYFYVCGDAHAMAKDVEQALVQMVASEGQMSQEEAKEYVKALRKEKRYLRDIY